LSSLFLHIFVTIQPYGRKIIEPAASLLGKGLLFPDIWRLAISEDLAALAAEKRRKPQI
jgi:hypothetical protein